MSESKFLELRRNLTSRHRIARYCATIICDSQHFAYIFNREVLRKLLRQEHNNNNMNILQERSFLFMIKIEKKKSRKLSIFIDPLNSY